MKWEYTWFRLSDIREFGKRLDEQGLKEWELVNVTSVRADTAEEKQIMYTAFMKRPKQ